ncbi:LOW QUALITY PROTEIN: uncharacterized protein [Drosophila tropicalis]|uniref:LOW QUALITY PROTEIN: uncharacterized protein n=1 Tax=Drosophila tropicalis TaxID=46794 RepID=UPI0035AC277E
MRNCLPKFTNVFRSKSSSTTSSSRRRRRTSDLDTDSESDVEQYVAAKAVNAVGLANVKPTASRCDQLRDNDDDDDGTSSSRNRLIRETITTTTTTTTNTTATATAGNLDQDKDVKSKVWGADGATRNGPILSKNGSSAEMKIADDSAAVAINTTRTFALRNSCKTPEEIELEYEANVKAEAGDIMTPLPRSLTFSMGRQMQTELEVIRNLDTQTQRQNNLSMPEMERNADDVILVHGDEGEDCVVLRRKVSSISLERKAHSLYERRMPKTPKLHLVVAGKKREPTDDNDEYKLFQVLITNTKFCLGFGKNN